jgi:hypothetical protein
MLWISRSRSRNILSHIERLLEIRSIGISVETGRKVHQNRLLRLAREGAQTQSSNCNSRSSWREKPLSISSDARDGS